MSKKELLFSVLRHESVPSVPWVPFAGVHAGKLMNYSAREVLTDKDKLVESLMAVNRQYDPDGQPVVFDLQIEAEILGCELVWAEKAPPSVATHPMAQEITIPNDLPGKNDGRLPLVLEAMREMKNKVGDHTALYGLVTGPFTLASHLRGTEIFMDMFDHPEDLDQLIQYCTEVAKRISEYYLEAGMDVIAIVDPLVSQISPKHFSRFLSQSFSDIFGFIRGLNAFSAFFVCGDATKNIEVMCQTTPDCIAVDENIDLVNAKKITDRYNIVIEGNIPLTTRMLLGNQQDNMVYVLDLMDALSSEGGAPQNLIISPGCDMPYDTPVDNVVGAMQAIREPETARLMAASYQAQEMDLEVIVIPDYKSLEIPLMEVFTLDSATCPACGYMLNAAQRAHEELAGAVDMVEYKITQPENIARMVKMGIKNLPSILINGELKFSSIIPSNRELIDELRRFL
ncbi:MAG: uroporphyrinogen decarboxylase [Chloroflexi bacterium]|nr:uroporphyrinogen decarboxylase [Chloroflexota bacterium]